MGWLTELLTELVYDELRALRRSRQSAARTAAGRHDEALSLQAEAVDLFRKMAEEDPRQRVGLAQQLVALGQCQARTGQYAEAVASTDEGSAILRKRAARYPQLRGHLADALYSLGLRQLGMDRTADALATFSETVALRREPSGGGLQKLGAALWVVARCQVALGQRQAAHATALEMLGTFRQVADDVPGSTDTLACAFAFLSSQESALGLGMEALRSAEVAVDLSTDDGPRTAAGPGVLAYALASLGSAQSAAGREQDALATTRKAVEHYRTLADTNPASFRQKLVEVLLDQVLQQFRLGLLEEARATAEEAVAIGRRLVSESPPHDSDRHRTHLATSLHNLALAQDSLGQLEPALETFKAAIDVARAVTVGKPRESLGTLVNLLSNLAAHYYRVGLHREAHRVGVEATALARDFAAATPDLGLPFLARNLNHLCVFLSNLGMRAEAIETGREGLVLCRKLHAEHPQQHGGRLAQALINLAHALEAVGGHEEASGLFAEEVALRGADAGRPPAVRGSLAVSLIQMME